MIVRLSCLEMRGDREGVETIKRIAWKRGKGRFALCLRPFGLWAG